MAWETEYKVRKRTPYAEGFNVDLAKITLLKDWVGGPGGQYVNTSEFPMAKEDGYIGIFTYANTLETPGGGMAKVKCELMVTPEGTKTLLANKAWSYITEFEIDNAQAWKYQKINIGEIPAVEYVLRISKDAVTVDDVLVYIYLVR